MLKTQDLSAYKTAGTVYVKDPKSKNVLLYLPFANSAKITLKGDKVEALAQGENCVTFPKASTLDLEFEVQLFNLNILSFITGSTVGESTKEFTKREVFTLNSSNEQVEIKGTPFGDKIQAVIVSDDVNNSTHLKELELATYDNGTKKATLNGANKGDVVAVYYFESSLCNGISVKATPEKQANYEIDAIFEGKSSDDAGTMSLLNIIAPKCTFTSDFDITFDATNASSFTIKLSASKSSSGYLFYAYYIPLEKEIIEEAPTILDLDATVVGTSAVLTWTKPSSEITSLKLMYKKDLGNYEDVNTDGSTGVNIPTPLTGIEKKVTVSGLVASSDYKFKLVITKDGENIDSNEVGFRVS